MDLLLFDVDGTIAESGKQIDTDMQNIIQKLQSKYDLGIVGGGKHDKIMFQLGNTYSSFKHIFSENGCVYNKENTLIYSKNIREHELYNSINILMASGEP